MGSHFQPEQSTLTVIPPMIHVLQSSQVKLPPKIPLINLVESVGSRRFQIQLFILVRVMSREFTREVVLKFLPAQFPELT